VTGFAIAWALAIAAIVGLALVLPCKACRLRRERLERAYENWKKSRSGP
jgi:hypothetical protein